ncbi:MAG TPA: GNAT family N-acetyltransferase [Actinomycetes bacterium]|jgi:ribosomal protein S18 acetylase RimI-like enzyme|nr:GNAT family N-acetyltransferase [Actinomycetes bacterium]
MRLAVVPFEEEHLDAAGELLAARHRDDRAAEALLPEAADDPTVARAAVAAAAAQPATSGASALRGGRLVGYLLGSRMPEDIVPRSAWVRPAGHALARDEDPGLYHDLYAVAGQPWVAAGCFSHFVVAPAADARAAAAWFALGFGQEQVYALRGLTEADAVARPPVPEGGTGIRAARPLPPEGGIEIRLAGPGDLDLVMELAGAISRHQAGPPVWQPSLPEFLAQLRESQAELLADPTATYWLAVGLGGRLLGFEVMLPAEADEGDLRTPARCIHLMVAATRTELRGGGVGLALTAHALAAAREAGYETCITDWRSANLLASRFWSGRGFRPVALRLRRSIDPRIAWADGRG